MSFSINDELNQTFGLAALNNQANKILNVKERQSYHKITANFALQQKSLKRDFELEYKTRVEVATRRLINKAGSKTKNFLHPWARNDRFDKATIHRQARREVHAIHQVNLSLLTQDEVRQKTSLLKNCEHRQRLREMPKRDFNRATNRRRGDERRKPISMNRSR